MQEINTDHLMIRWLSILVLLSLLGCGEDKLELGIEGKVLGESGQPIPAATVKIDGPESLTMAMNAAESHLVLTTSISFGGTGWAIRKLFDFFPDDRQEYVQTHLSRVLRALIWQHLIPLEGHTGTKIAMETMFNNERIAEFIQKNQLHKVHGEIQKERSLHMITN